MKLFKNEEEAVSPVIGVILMVAIVVILAAVIAAFVFGMAGGVAPSKSVAATAAMQGDTVIVTYQGGKDAGDLALLTLTIDGTTTPAAGTLTPFPAPAAGTPPAVGDQATYKKGAATTKYHVVVKATFTDNTEQIILDQNI